MLVDPVGLLIVCCIYGALCFVIGWMGGAVSAIQRRREFDEEQRAASLPATSNDQQEKQR